MSTKTTPAAQPTLEQLTEQVAALTAALAKKNAAPPVTMKVSEKKAVSVYGLGRFPVTLYKSQMLKLVELAKSGKIEQFITEHNGELAEKPAA